MKALGIIVIITLVACFAWFALGTRAQATQPATDTASATVQLATDTIASPAIIVATSAVIEVATPGDIATGAVPVASQP